MHSSPRVVRITAASLIALVSCSPCLAQHRHGARQAAASSKPANASEPFCRSKARDYAYEKHADPGQERLFFDKCMGR